MPLEADLSASTILQWVTLSSAKGLRLQERMTPPENNTDSMRSCLRGRLPALRLQLRIDFSRRSKVEESIQRRRFLHIGALENHVESLLLRLFAHGSIRRQSRPSGIVTFGCEIFFNVKTAGQGRNRFAAPVCAIAQPLEGCPNELLDESTFGTKEFLADYDAAGRSNDTSFGQGNQLVQARVLRPNVPWEGKKRSIDETAHQGG